MNVGTNTAKLDVEVDPTESISNVISCLDDCIEFVATVPDTPEALVSSAFCCESLYPHNGCTKKP